VSILNKLFHLKGEEILGITSSNKKFYDMESFAFNIQAFNKQTIELVTSSIVNQHEEAFPQIEDQNDFNIEPISFGTHLLIQHPTLPMNFKTITILSIMIQNFISMLNFQMSLSPK
jgi:hypothetical protein